MGSNGSKIVLGEIVEVKCTKTDPKGKVFLVVFTHSKREKLIAFLGLAGASLRCSWLGFKVTKLASTLIETWQRWIWEIR